MRRSPGSVPLLFVLVLFILSGATGLIYEVIWTRALTLVFGKTVHAASAVLVAFMGGLALGSAVGGRAIDRSRLSPLRIYGWLEAGIGLWALVLPAVVKGIGLLYTSLSGPFEQLPVTLSILRFVLATVALVPATALMGATLPALSRWAVRGESQVASRLGLLYALNTVGGVTGCLTAGFVLLQALGLRGTTITAALGNFLVAGIAFVLARREGEGAGTLSYGTPSMSTEPAPALIRNARGPPGSSWVPSRWAASGRWRWRSSGSACCCWCSAARPTRSARCFRSSCSGSGWGVSWPPPSPTGSRPPGSRWGSCRERSGSSCWARCTPSIVFPGSISS